jgi:hypothetical protein
MSGATPESRRPELTPAQRERALEERAGRVRSRFFLASLFLVLITLAVGVFSDALAEEARGYARLVGVFCISLAGPVFASAFLVGTFLRLQVYITDLIFLTSVAAFLLSLLVSWVSEAQRRPDAAAIAAALATCTVPLLLFGGGVAWGLSTAKRLNEQRAFRRIGLFVMGWFLLFGVLALLAFPFLFLKALLTWECSEGFVGCVVLLLFGLPGAYVELYYRRRYPVTPRAQGLARQRAMKARPAQPTEMAPAAPPPADAGDAPPPAG